MILLTIPYETFRLLNFTWMGTGLLTFVVLLKINAPYGRFSTASWGTLIDNRLAWFLMEAPVLLIVSAYVFLNHKGLSVPVMIMTLLFCAHYIHRSFIFPWRLHTAGKKMPMVIMGSAILFNIINGTLIGYYFRNFAQYDVSWLHDKRFIIGLLIFLTGMYINISSDNILINLRKEGGSGYRIPFGFLFKQVSCPNHFGEMLEWLGFAVLCWNLPAWSFFIWTVANLLPRSLAHHRWYREKFNDYPASRKAVLPFLV